MLAFPYFHFEQRIGYHEGIDKPRKIGKSVGERRTDNQYPECIGEDVGACQEFVGLAAQSALYAHIPHEPYRYGAVEQKVPTESGAGELFHSFVVDAGTQIVVHTVVETQGGEDVGYGITE